MTNIFKNLSLNGTPTDIICRNGKIEKIGKTDLDGIDFHGLDVYPGLIDIHTHGAVGADTMDDTPEILSDFEAKNGITSFLPTTMTVSNEALASVLNKPLPNVSGAQILGYHLEGPYINEKYKGAQNSKYIRTPDIEEFSKLQNIKMVTIAPELENSLEFIKNSGAVVSIGHTDADYETALAAADAGAKCITHTFNAMPPLHHRMPSVIGAASDRNMYAQVICDGIHIHPSVIRILYKLFTAERMILISDSMRATGLPDGTYDLGGQNIIVKDKVARTEDGALAGSTSTLFDCVKFAISFGIPKADAFKMASETPAKLMGFNKGVIREGYDCDLLILDNKLNIKAVIIGGEIFNGGGKTK